MSNQVQYQAIFLLIVGGFFLAFQDSLVKFSSSSTSFWQFQTLRAICNLILLVFVPVLFKTQFSVLIPKNKTMVSLRTLTLVLCMFCFFSAAPTLTFAQMATGLYTYPLFVVALAIFFLNEKLSKLKIIALSLGTIGAFLVIKPWEDEFSFLQILPIMAGLFYACNLLFVRKFCSHESPFAMTAAVAIGFLVSGTLGCFIIDRFFSSEILKETMPFIAVGWPELTTFIIGIVIVASILNLLGNLCLVRAYQTSESSWIAPLDFVYLIFALLWGKVMFDQLPNMFELSGIVCIFLSGIIVAFQAFTNKKTLKTVN